MGRSADPWHGSDTASYLRVVKASTVEIFGDQGWGSFAVNRTPHLLRLVYSFRRHFSIQGTVVLAPTYDP